MSNTTNSIQPASPKPGGGDFYVFIGVRIVGALIVAAALLWGALKLIERFPGESAPGKTAALEAQPTSQVQTSKKYADAHDPHGGPAVAGPLGTAFVDALMAPMTYELKHRFWGWRPNDIIRVTDNVNQYQLGVLEATRRVSRVLTDNISRTGSTAAINKHLERAMNAFMIRADRYLFPSAENQYNEALANLENYKQQLINKETIFYTRTDTLLPLLQVMEELIGSCDENLVKTHEDTGEAVSTFQADNYYYYAKGVAGAFLPLFMAIEQDFKQVLITRNAQEIIDDAIEACHHAVELDPWLFVTEGDLNGIIANHRANLGAPISHIRFYLGLMVKSLST